MLYLCQKKPIPSILQKKSFLIDPDGTGPGHLTIRLNDADIIPVVLFAIALIREFEFSIPLIMEYNSVQHGRFPGKGSGK